MTICIPALSHDQQHDLSWDEGNGREDQKQECSSYDQKPRVFISHAAKLAVSVLTSAMGRMRTLRQTAAA